MSLLEQALAAHAAGLSVVPVKQDGSKTPDGPWARYQSRRADEPQVRAWFTHGRTGMGIVTGALSGVEMLEFEGRAVAEGVFGQFRDLVNEAGLGNVLDRIVDGFSEISPAGGVHLIYRCPQIEGNTKLARRPATEAELEADRAAGKKPDRVKVLIETRGEGGFVVTAPSHGNVHPTGEPWVIEHGGFDTIAHVSVDERGALFAIARQLDQMAAPPVNTPPPAARPNPPTTGFAHPDSPLERFDAEHTCDQILERNGFTRHNADAKGVHYTRPGKDPRHGSSASVWADDGTCTLFSSSIDAPTEYIGNRKLRPSQLAAALEHQGDHTALAATITGATSTSSADLVWHRPLGVMGDQATEPPADTTPADQIRARLLHGDQILNIPPKQPLIDGLIDQGDFACMFGRSNAGKTFVAMDIAGCVATGTWWHGAQVTRGTVLYVIAEGAPGIPKRWRAWKHANGIHSDIANIHWLPVRVNLRSAQWATAVAEVAAELDDLALIFVDTLARTFGGGNENASEDMGAYVAGADTIRETTGAAIVIVHHTGKDESAGSRGHSSLLGALDVELAIRNGGDGIISLESTKQKDRGATASLRFALEPHGESVAIVRYDGRNHRNENLTAKYSAALRALQRIATTEGVTMTAWRDTASEDGVGRSTFYEARKTLLEQGLVRTLGTDEKGPFVPVSPDQEPDPT